jgi:hypothetical protein
MAQEIHKGDIGTVFELTVRDQDGVVDLSGATVKDFYFRQPSGKTKPKVTALFKTDGTDGILTYTTVAGNLDENGTWQLQADVETSNGRWRTNIVTFVVHANL